MLPDRVSNPGPLTYESGALPIALRGPAGDDVHSFASEHICLCAHDFCMPQRALSNANEKRLLVCV